MNQIVTTEGEYILFTSRDIVTNNVQIVGWHFANGKHTRDQIANLINFVVNHILPPNGAYGVVNNLDSNQVCVFTRFLRLKKSIKI